jgi:hypothetical protein
MNNFLFFIQLNLVLININGHEVSVPTDLSYSSEVMYVALPDTVITYNVVSQSGIIGLAGIGYTGLAVDTKSTFYIYIYSRGTRLEMMFVKDRELYRKLKQ